MQCRVFAHDPRPTGPHRPSKISKIKAKSRQNEAPVTVTNCAPKGYKPTTQSLTTSDSKTQAKDMAKKPRVRLIGVPYVKDASSENGGDFKVMIEMKKYEDCLFVFNGNQRDDTSINPREGERGRLSCEAFRCVDLCAKCE